VGIELNQLLKRTVAMLALEEQIGMSLDMLPDLLEVLDRLPSSTATVIVLLSSLIQPNTNPLGRLVITNVSQLTRHCRTLSLLWSFDACAVLSRERRGPH